MSTSDDNNSMTVVSDASSAHTNVSSSSSCPKTIDKKRQRRQCSYPDCTKVDAGGGSCVAHGGDDMAVVHAVKWLGARK
ncbi:unnamed protein product [Peronospora effusa]|nr:unnamed protein product [Peronospora effusa]